MRIIHVRDVASVGTQLVRALNVLGHEAKLRTFQESTESNLFLKSLILPRRIREASAVNSYIHDQGFDVVHFHYANSGWIGTLGRYPYVLHCHGSDVRSDLYSPLRKHLVTYSLKYAKMVLISTPDLYQHVKLIREDAIFLPNPIDTTLFSPDDQGTGTVTSILINMSLKKSKAPEIAFEAADKIQKVFPNIEIYAFVSGPEFNHFKQYGDVNFIDPIPHENMPNLVNSFDIILGQFSIGSLGMSELESMACSKPVICNVDEVLYNQWYDDLPPVFTAESSAGVVEILVGLIESRDLRLESGQHAREWILKYHDYLSVARELIEFYRKVL